MVTNKYVRSSVKEEKLPGLFYFFSLPRKIDKMRKALTLSLIVTVLGLAAYILKPSEKECIQKARQEFRKKITYTIQASPKEVDKNLFALALEKNFLQELEVKDKFLYRDIYRTTGEQKIKIGWAVLGWINVDIK